jgi:hypothetical protein
MAVAIAGVGAVPVLLEGCRSSSPERAHVGVETPAPATLTSARAADTAALGALMHEHDVHGAAMRDAVARADLDGARREATVLAELRVDRAADPAWRARLDAMSAAAARVVRAKDLPDASAAVADVARTCGDCHRLGGPSLGILEKPENEPGIVPGMKRHQWAVARLWDGLVIPSDRAWRAGAHVLRDAPLQPEPPRPGQSPLPLQRIEQLAIATLATSVHDLAERASVANASVDRGAVYGELLTTCAACHAHLAQGLR